MIGIVIPMRGSYLLLQPEGGHLIPHSISANQLLGEPRQSSLLSRVLQCYL
uniref:Uncharacterized protein n=1 Tax=Xanthomonas phage MK21 TaxID=3148942 RepID=A0AAU7J8P6_9CAUD